MTDTQQDIYYVVPLRGRGFFTRFYGGFRRAYVTHMLIAATTVELQGYGLPGWRDIFANGLRPRLLPRLQTRPQDDSSLREDFKGLTQDHWDLIDACRSGPEAVDELHRKWYPNFHAIHDAVNAKKEAADTAT